MSDAYHVEVDQPACEHCGLGETYNIVDLTGCAIGVSFSDRTDAEEWQMELDRAYRAGQQSVWAIMNRRTGPGDRRQALESTGMPMEREDRRKNAGRRGYDDEIPF